MRDETAPRSDPTSALPPPTNRWLCLFGGAFNPPHLTHERILRAALAQLPVDRAVVLPAGRHPHKLDDHTMATAEQRLELCALAFAGIPGVEVSDWEVRRPGPSYTVETIAHFREGEPAGGRPFWIIGSDNLTLLPTWHRHHELLASCRLAVYPRAGHPVSERALADLDLDARERREVLAHVLVTEPDDVSATDIRHRLSAGESLAELLHPAVERRIRELGLYGTARP